MKEAIHIISLNKNRRKSNSNFLLSLADKGEEIVVSLRDVLFITSIKRTHNDKIGYLKNGAKVIFRNVNFKKVAGNNNRLYTGK